MSYRVYPDGMIEVEDAGQALELRDRLMTAIAQQALLKAAIEERTRIVARIREP